MKKSISLLALMFVLIQFAGAQAILPASWDFDAVTPVGWTESLGGSNTRYATGQAGQACKLDATGDYVTLEFAEEPGALTYYLKSQGGSFQGEFTIQESVDGSVYTALHTFLDGEIPSGAFTQFTEAPAATTRFIRFYYTLKVSGTNVGLDEVNLATPIAGTAQEINIMEGANNVPSGFEYNTGNNASTDFTIQNLGSLNVLNISSIDLTGVNADQFSLSNVPTSVPALGMSNFTLSFNPVGLGSRFCTITVNSNDASEGVYVINIYAIAGDFAAEPTAQSGALTFPNLNSWDFNVNITNGSPAAEKYLVLRKKGGAVTSSPVDGTTYVRGEWIGDAQVVYANEAGQFNARNIESSTAYHLAVFAYNGPEGFENYLTTAPVTGIATTNGAAIGTYYSGLNHNSTSFVTDLTARLNPANYFQVYYANYISTLIDNFYVKDTAIGGVSFNAVECQYSGNNYVYAASFQWSNGDGVTLLSREHCYPQSWMPTYLDANFDSSPEVSDLHNLIPVEQDNCNAVRSNYPYGEVTDVTSTYLGTTYGQNDLNQTIYEPREVIKGNAARAIMYHATKNNSTTNDFSLPEQISPFIPYGQNEYLLKQWHFGDMPDNFEIARNEYIFEQQNNRNPFIDSITYPCFIRFGNLTKWEPIFTNSSNQLTCVDPGLSYQWYKDGVAVSGATSANYSITTSANYSVAVQQFSQCPVIQSTPLQVNYIGVNELNASIQKFAVYPNPSKGSFNLNFVSNSNQKITFTIVDITGKVIQTSTQAVSTGQNNIAFDTQLSAGIYMIELNASGVNYTQRLVIE